MSEESPFLPGVRIAIEGHGMWAERFVDKVYKNGNFTVKGDQGRQQWRPRWSRGWGKDAGIEWRAEPTGRDVWVRPSAHVWDEELDAVIRQENEQRARRKRFSDLLTRMQCVGRDRWTDEALDQIEAALKSLEQQP